MKNAISETDRRRRIQKTYNKEHNIIPVSIEKKVAAVFSFPDESKTKPDDIVAEAISEYHSLGDLDIRIKDMEEEMAMAAKELAFEKAAQLRDQIKELKKIIVFEL